MRCSLGLILNESFMEQLQTVHVVVISTFCFVLIQSLCKQVAVISHDFFEKKHYLFLIVM